MKLRTFKITAWFITKIIKTECKDLLWVCWGTLYCL